MLQTTTQAYPKYLQTAAELNNQIKRQSYSLMHIQPGQNVLDVGCGPGIDTVALAHLVGPQGSVVGVDFDKSMIAEADRYAEQSVQPRSHRPSPQIWTGPTLRSW